MYHVIDEDEWETVVEVGGNPARISGVSVYQRRRAPADVARIKAERLRKEEDEILRRADEIRARRGDR